mmetsp:Transcript_13655/g.57407  ORF Transcript_13655/g.57407 Transcript_13655/m.57407 type:complete len:206 (-) Transcript_13655:349-966(-)
MSPYASELTSRSFSTTAAATRDAMTSSKARVCFFGWTPISSAVVETTTSDAACTSLCQLLKRSFSFFAESESSRPVFGYASAETKPHASAASTATTATAAPSPPHSGGSRRTRVAARSSAHVSDRSYEGEPITTNTSHLNAASTRRTCVCFQSRYSERGTSSSSCQHNDDDDDLFLVGSDFICMLLTASTMARTSARSANGASRA